MRNLIYIFILAFSLSLSSCGNDEEFVIRCDIKGLGSKGVEMCYVNRDLKKALFHPVDGKVVLRGVSPQPTLVEVFTFDGELLFACVASNGDDLEVKMNSENPGVAEIKGNEVSERYSKFVIENDSILFGGDREKSNRIIAAEILSNPDRMSSAMLLATLYDARGYEMQADSLINALSARARPSGVCGCFISLVGEQVSASARGNVKSITIRANPDTLVRFIPSMQSYSLLAFSGVGRTDSLKSLFRDLNKNLHKRRFTLLEMTVTGDSASWAGAIRGDSAKWVQAWLPGGVGNPAVRNLQIPYIPFFVFVDSSGRQIYRGGSVSAVSDSVRHRLGKHYKGIDCDVVSEIPATHRLGTSGNL